MVLAMPTPNDKLMAKSYRIVFDTQKATLESAMQAIKEILDRSGCANCGRLGGIELEIDPRVNIAREIAGVREITETFREATITHTVVR